MHGEIQEEPNNTAPDDEEEACPHCGGPLRLVHYAFECPACDAEAYEDTSCAYVDLDRERWGAD